VLWCAIAALASHRQRSRLRVVVYSGDVGVPPDDIVRRACERFGIVVPADLALEFVFVTRRHLLEGARWV